MEYRLVIDGDDMEKVAWGLFVQSKFPNYEIFWQKFVVPRTKRSSGQGIMASKGIPSEEKIISMLHYSILNNMYLYYAYFNQINDVINGANVFEFLYIKLSSIIDMTEEFLYRYLVFLGKVNKTKIHEQNADKSIKYNIKEATKYLEKGQNYSKTFTSVPSFIFSVTFATILSPV